MAIKMETQELLLSVEQQPDRRPYTGRQPAEPVASNRRRVVTGVIISLAVLIGAVIWQYVDNQAAFPASAQTGEELPLIGSTALESDSPQP